MCGVYGKGFAAVLWMQWTEHYCHFKGKRRCCSDQDVSWDKCSGKAGVRERHTFSIQEKLERSRSDEMLGCGRTGMMAHSNHERDTSAVLRKSFKSSLCCQQTAGISQEGIVQLWIQTAKFFISSFAVLCLGLRVVFHKNVSWIGLRLNVLTKFLVRNALLWKHH